ncbi:MAG: hypothetical protein R3C18_07360 [Planctomycetaceae bacterium]
MPPQNELNRLAQRLLDLLGEEPSRGTNAADAADSLGGVTYEDVVLAAQELANRSLVSLGQDSSGSITIELTEEGSRQSSDEVAGTSASIYRCPHCEVNFGQDIEAWRAHDCPEKPKHTMGLS